MSVATRILLIWLVILTACGSTEFALADEAKPFVPSALDVREVAGALLPQLGRADAPGEVLFQDDFSADKAEERWGGLDGWNVVDLPDGSGCCATDQALPGGGYQVLTLKAPLPLRPGHPVAVYWRVRGVTPDSETVWINAGFSGDNIADLDGIRAEMVKWIGQLSRN